MSPSSAHQATGVSSSAALPLVLTACLAGVAVATLAAGLPRGDVTAAEARYLLEARGPSPARPSVANAPSSSPAAKAPTPNKPSCHVEEPPSGRYGRGLRPFVQDAEPPSAPTIARGLSTLAVVLLAAALATEVARQSGLVAACASLVMTCLSLPALQFGRMATPDAWSATLGVVGVLLVAAGFEASRTQPLGAVSRLLRISTIVECRLVRLVAGCLALIWSAVLWGETASATWTTSPADRGLAALSVVALSMPWLVVASPVLMTPWWQGLDRGQRRAGFLSGLLALAAVSLALIRPAGWQACALVFAASVSLAGGLAYEPWRAARLPLACQQRLDRLWQLVLGLFPMTLVVSGVARIALRYQFMERVQAVVVVALAALVVGAVLCRRRARVALLVPVAACLVACKFLLISVLVGERDQAVSARPFAQAVGRAMPQGTVLGTPLPLTDDWRYYLEAPLVVLPGPVSGAPFDAAIGALLLPESALAEPAWKLDQSWQVVRRFEGPFPQPCYLLRRSGVPIQLSSTTR